MDWTGSPDQLKRERTRTTDAVARDGDARGEAAVPRAGACYDGAPESIAAARSFTAEFLTRVRAVFGLQVSAEATATSQLVVSELVTNACKYAPGPCLLDLEVTGGLMEITVWDANPVPPVVCGTDPGRVGRHGLEIVLALCESLDITLPPVGKRITARVALAR
ncbi:ATP-binding protein [Streptomyces sp. CAU 1734]|uniref:ATP-binding protein n=1 Tax=Streptomyces sp. CAU 1734 TaxID=3140360 RepID=UPI0032609BD1